MTLCARLQFQAMGMMDCESGTSRKFKSKEARKQYAIGYGIQYSIEQNLTNMSGA